MKLKATIARRGLAAAAFLALHFITTSIHAQGTAFTYHGLLNDAGAPATGIYDLRFTVHDALNGGSQIGATVDVNDQPVTNGLFTVTIDPGTSVFTGPARWLNMAVRPGASSGAYTSLVPRQPITPTPYAVYAGGANATGLSGTLPAAALSGAYSGSVNFSNAANNFAGNGRGLTNLSTTNLIGTLADARLSTNVALLNANQTFSGVNTFSRRLTVSETGASPQLAVGRDSAHGLSLYNWFSDPMRVNIDPLASGTSFHFGRNTLLAQTTFESGNVGIGTANPPHKFDVNWGNTTDFASFGDVHGSGPLLYLSTTPANGTVSVQSRNGHDLIFTSWPGGGGTQNELMRIKANGNVGIGTPSPNGQFTVGGTSANVTLNNSVWTQFTGGGLVDINGTGFLGEAGTPGNPAYHICLASTAGGAQLRLGANAGIRFYPNSAISTFDPNPGQAPAMTVSQGGNVGIGTTAPDNQLTVSKNGGAEIAMKDPSGDPSGYWKMSAAAVFPNRWGVLRYNYDNSPAGSSFTGAGFIVGPSGDTTVFGDVSCVALNITSDREAKKDFKAINAREVLDKVAKLPITEWQYKQDTHQTPARHIGPVAQDFRDAFGVGRDEKHITSVDADGVALAAIQGLNEKVDEKDARILELENAVAELKELVTRLARQQDGGAK